MYIGFVAPRADQTWRAHRMLDCLSPGAFSRNLQANWPMNDFLDSGYSHTDVRAIDESPVSGPRI